MEKDQIKDSIENENIKDIIESLLFVSDAPITVKQIRMALIEVPSQTIVQALKQLANEYDEKGGGFYLSHVAGGYQLRTRPQYKEFIKRLIRNRPTRLSRAALEVLAIIAYKQPATRSDIEHIRGVDSSTIVKTLQDLKLVRMIGRKESPGRPMLFSTTRRFLEVFELNDLNDLPSPEEFKATDKIEVVEDMETNKRIQQLDDNKPINDDLSQMEHVPDETQIEQKPDEEESQIEHGLDGSQIEHEHDESQMDDNKPINNELSQMEHLPDETQIERRPDEDESQMEHEHDESQMEHEHDDSQMEHEHDDSQMEHEHDDSQMEHDHDESQMEHDHDESQMEHEEHEHDESHIEHEHDDSHKEHGNL